MVSAKCGSFREDMGTLRRFEGGPDELHYNVREMPIWGSSDATGTSIWGTWMSILLVENKLAGIRVQGV